MNDIKQKTIAKSTAWHRQRRCDKFHNSCTFFQWMWFEALTLVLAAFIRHFFFVRREKRFNFSLLSCGHWFHCSPLDFVYILGLFDQLNIRRAPRLSEVYLKIFQYKQMTWNCWRQNTILLISHIYHNDTVDFWHWMTPIVRICVFCWLMFDKMCLWLWLLSDLFLLFSWF